jgi:hypothetical protein
MPQVSDPAVLGQLEARLEALRPDSARRWGQLSPAEVLCHLADATASVLGRPGGAPGPPRWFRKWVALRSPMPWPQGAPTPAHVNPRASGTRPTDFELDRRRALEGLRAVAAAPAEALPAAHALFGAMSADDWRHWAYRHTDHHLRQFGL